MQIFGISGSASNTSSNYYLLEAIKNQVAQQDDLKLFEGLQQFDLFSPKRLEKGVPDNIREFKKKLLTADLIIISTPEYLHNIPAVLKNMLEWCSASGEFADKSVLPITFTPYQPRGKYAMTSLLNSLQAMSSKVETQMPLYKTDVNILEHHIELPQEIQEIIKTAIALYR